MGITLAGPQAGVGVWGQLALAPVMVLGLLATAPHARADAAAPADPEETSVPAQTEPAKAARLQVAGFVDGYFASDFNQPVDHANFFPGVGTAAKRDNELGINLAQVDLVLVPAPVGAKLSLGFGTAPEVLHAAELRGIATRPDVWRNVLQASAQWQTRLGRGLLLEAGIYPSHIGMEAFQTRHNWNYTRSWLGELSPYYQTGLKLAYPFSDGWSAQLHLLNGWQVIGDNNRGKSVGAQIAYGSERFSISLNGIAGPELAGDDASWRGVGLYARLAPKNSRTAFALRAEYYDDEDGAISGLAQTLKEITATLEHRPVERLILKLEGRYDRSSAPAFASDEMGLDGAPQRKNQQFLLLLGVVANF